MDETELEARLLGLLRGEHSSLTISLNDHASDRCSVAEAIELGLYDDADWVSADEKAKAIATNRAWRLQWYPDTPVASRSVLAATLPVALRAAFAAAAGDRL